MIAIRNLDLPQVLVGLARSQLGHGIGVAAVDVAGKLPGLMPAEEAAVADAVDSRRREFAAGRAAARTALAEVGVTGQPIPAGADRAPVWPGRTVGSITHSDRVALAAVGRMEQVQSIGIDVEPSTPLDLDLLDGILTPDERRRLAHLPPARQRTQATVIFSAKECAFKCQYPLTGAMLDFHDMEIELDPATKRFHAIASGYGAGSDPANRMTGRYAMIMGHVLTTLALRRQ